jgi:hypothetical protein
LVNVGVTVKVELMGTQIQGQMEIVPEGQGTGGHDLIGQLEVVEVLGLGVVVVNVGFEVVSVNHDDDGNVAVTV